MEIVKDSASRFHKPFNSPGPNLEAVAFIEPPAGQKKITYTSASPKGTFLFDPQEDTRLTSENMSVRGFFNGYCHDILELIENLCAFNPCFILVNPPVEHAYIISTIRLIHSQFSHIQILLLLDENMFGSAQEFLRTGAFGFIAKHETVDMILHYIRQMESGCFPVPRAIYENLVAPLRPQHEKTYLQHYHFTHREQEIMHHMLGGCSYKIIAARLNIRYHTVHNHIKKIYAKLGVNSMSEAITKVFRQT